METFVVTFVLGFVGIIATLVLIEIVQDAGSPDDNDDGGAL